MSDFAHVKTEDGFAIVRAKECVTSCPHKEFFCPYCRMPMYLRGIGTTKVPHFFGKHMEGCDLKVYKKTMKVLRDLGFTPILTAILGHIDKADDETRRVPGPGPAPGPNVGGNPEKDEMPNYQRGYRALRNVGALYRALLFLPLDYPLGVDGEITVGDLMIREENLLEWRTRGLDGKIAMVVTRRVNPDPALKVPGYIVLRDVYSSSNQKAFYFLVKLKEPNQNRLFVERLLSGNKNELIVLISRWRKAKNESYDNVYMVDVDFNSACLCYAK